MNIINKLREKKWMVIFIIYLRYLIGGAFVFSSIVKIQGFRFTTEDGISSPINSAWHLFETLYQSGLYWQFLGWGQLIVGMLLMTQRFALLGAVFSLSISLNIFFITISYYFAFTPVITGLMLLSNVFLLCWDYNLLLPLFQSSDKTKLQVSTIHKIAFEKLWSYIGLILFIITVAFIVLDDKNPGLWFLSCLVIGLSGLIVVNIKNANSKKNSSSPLSSL